MLEEAKEDPAAVKARFWLFMQDGYLARLLEIGRLACMILQDDV